LARASAILSWGRLAGRRTERRRMARTKRWRMAWLAGRWRLPQLPRRRLPRRPPLTPTRLPFAVGGSVVAVGEERVVVGELHVAVERDREEQVHDERPQHEPLE